MDLGLESSPPLIELGANERDNIERAHDRCCFWQHVGGSFLVPSESTHRAVADADPEVIGLTVQPVAEGLGRTARHDIEQPGGPVSEVDDDSHPPVAATVRPAVLIDANRGHPSSREASARRSLRPRSRTAVHAVFHDVARFFTIAWMLILSLTTAFKAHERAARESFGRSTQALSTDWAQRCRRPGQIRMARVTAVSPIRGWMSSQILVARTSPRCPQPRQEGSSSVAVHRTAKCLPMWCWPVAVSPGPTRATRYSPPLKSSSCVAAVVPCACSTSENCQNATSASPWIGRHLSDSRRRMIDRLWSNHRKWL